MYNAEYSYCANGRLGLLLEFLKMNVTWGKKSCVFCIPLIINDQSITDCSWINLASEKCMKFATPSHNRQSYCQHYANPVSTFVVLTLKQVCSCWDQIFMWEIRWSKTPKTPKLLTSCWEPFSVRFCVLGLSLKEILPTAHCPHFFKGLFTAVQVGFSRSPRRHGFLSDYLT